MANIRIDLEATVTNGQALTFKSPADCSQVTGLIIYYPVGNTTTSKTFKFVDAHGVDVGSGTISLFAANVLVKVVLDIDEGKAYVQNADTNAYLEGEFAKKVALSTVVVDDALSYVKEPPAESAPYAKVLEIGGITRKCTNLIPFPYIGVSNTANGVTYTINQNGTISFSGKITSGFTVVLCEETFSAGEYYLSDGCSEAGVYFIAYDIDASAVLSYEGTFTLTKSTKVRVYYLISDVFDGAATVYPMLNSGSTALPYEPYFEGLRSAPVTEVESVGANLIPFPYTITDGGGIGGVTWKLQDDGAIVLNGSWVFDHTNNIMFTTDIPLKAGTYHISDNAIGDGGLYVILQYTNSGGTLSYVYSGNSFTIETDKTVSVMFQIQPHTTYSNKKICPMLNKGSTALPYTPYRRDTLPIPAAVQALDGYGEGNPDNAEEYNAIICKDGKWKYSHKGDIDNNVWTPLATTEITNISDLLPDDNLIRVEGGGTVTLVNEYGYDVPSTMEFYEGVNDTAGAKQFVGNLLGTATKAKTLVGLIAKIAELNHLKGIRENIQKQLDGKSSSAHTHAKSEITDFPSVMTPTAHSHKKSEITDFPSAMTPTSHTHSKSEITDFPSSMPPTSHSHKKSEITDFPSSMPPTSHNQAASTITEGTFAGQVVANASGQAPGTSLLRNSRLVTTNTNPNVNGEINWTYK